MSPTESTAPAAAVSAAPLAPDSGRRRRWSVRATWAWLVLMAGLHAWQAASVSDTFSTTFDEIAHLTAGTLYWRERDYRTQPENGILPQRWAALPVAWRADVKSPDLNSNHGRIADVWRMGEWFFHQSGNDLASMLRSGRAMIALLGGVLVFALGRWAWQLGGPLAAFAASTLAAFSPTLLAHAGLITSDTAAALGFVMVLAAWWRLLHAITPTRVLWAGLATGYLAVTKFSVVLAPFMVLALLALRMLRRAPLPVRIGKRQTRVRGWRRLGAFGAASVVCVALTLVVIWSAYGFRFEARGPNAQPNASFFEFWDIVLIEKPIYTGLVMADGAVQGNVAIIEAGPLQATVRWARDHHVLPEAWLFGLAYVDRNKRFRPAFFAGEWQGTGWRLFFPTAYLMKSTWPELALHAAALGLLAVACWRKRLRRLAYRTAPLLALVAVYGGFSLWLPLNIGHRHILPLYAAGAILAGVVWAIAWERRGGWRWAAGALLLLQVGTACLARPDYLAYFNWIAGGTSGAHRYFVDSSLDWGQDLPRLAQWEKNKGDALPVYLSYFGSGAPAYYGIKAKRTGDTYCDVNQDRPLVPVWSEGWFVISATMWQRVNSEVRGPWNLSYEEHYLALREWLLGIQNQPPNAPVRGLDGKILSMDEGRKLLTSFDQLRFGRLCHFLQGRTPDARIGATFFAFRLTREDVFRVLYGPLDPPLTTAPVAPARL